MYIRSMLYTPGDDPGKLAKVDGSDADATVLDLEDSVPEDRKDLARQKVRQFLDARPPEQRRSQLWVRIGAFDDTALLDLAAVVGGSPDGIVLPKIDGPEDVEKLGHMLDVLEAREHIEHGATKICAVATETPAAVLRLHEFATKTLPRLTALSWGAEDLSAALGATSNLAPDGTWTLTYRWARSAVLLAARAASVQAIETVFVDYRDLDGLTQSSREAAREGFTGRAAIHPSQIEPINRQFAPSPEDVAIAEGIVKAFESSDRSVGTVGIAGKMYDIPHLKRAQNVLALHNHYTRGQAGRPET